MRGAQEVRLLLILLLCCPLSNPKKVCLLGYVRACVCRDVKKLYSRRRKKHEHRKQHHQLDGEMAEGVSSDFSVFFVCVNVIVCLCEGVCACVFV